MNLKIIKVYSHGVLDEEYVEITATSDCEIGKYLVSKSTNSLDGIVTNRLRYVYWFPDKKISKGDSIQLYTKMGQNCVTNNIDGKTIHTFYWNKLKAIWNDTGESVMLFKIIKWRHRKT